MSTIEHSAVQPAGIKSFRSPKQAIVLPSEPIRANVDQQIAQSNEILRANITRALGAIELPEDKFRRCLDNVVKVHSEYKSIKDRSLAIGRTLNEMLRTDPKVYRALIYSDTVFPFDPSVATKLRKIAEFVDGPQCPVAPNEVPSTWTAAYELATMSKDMIEHCRERGLLGENARTAPLRSVKKDQHKLRSSRQTNLMAALIAEEANLMRRKSKLEDDLRTVQARLMEIRCEREDLDRDEAELINHPPPQAAVGQAGPEGADPAQASAEQGDDPVGDADLIVRDEEGRGDPLRSAA